MYVQNNMSPFNVFFGSSHVRTVLKVLQKVETCLKKKFKLLLLSHPLGWKIVYVAASKCLFKTLFKNNMVNIIYV